MCRRTTFAARARWIASLFDARDLMQSVWLLYKQICFVMSFQKRYHLKEDRFLGIFHVFVHVHVFGACTLIRWENGFAIQLYHAKSFQKSGHMICLYQISAKFSRITCCLYIYMFLTPIMDKSAMALYPKSFLAYKGTFMPNLVLLSHFAQLTDFFQLSDLTIFCSLLCGDGFSFFFSFLSYSRGGVFLGGSSA